MFKDLGLEFEVIPADIDETMEDGERPILFARRVAKEKGLAVAKLLEQRNPAPWIVSADTIVVLYDEVLQKPRDKDDARAMLHKLQGRTHNVITAWAVGRNGAKWSINHALTKVTFHDLTDQQIDDYVATGEGMDKAGAYAIQCLGSFLVDHIEGNYFNVVGLPISYVARELLRVGAVERFPNP